MKSVLNYFMELDPGWIRPEIKLQLEIIGEFSGLFEF
jgi:hypothetical protein